METEEAQKTLENPEFASLIEAIQEMANEAQPELILSAELDDGNTEYKFKFDAPTMDRVQHLQTQMSFRLNEGNGIAFYQIGVLDSGQVTGL